MHRPAVSGGPVVSKVLLVGQAPGDREPVIGRPFAWTAGRTLFGWFDEACGLTEAQFRASIYMAAVCRCFPGKKPRGGDRVPTRQEVVTCANWLEAEFEILQPHLIIPVGKLAIERFIPYSGLGDAVGRRFSVRVSGGEADLIPLPHPSGASPWPRMEPGRTLLRKAMGLIAGHPAINALRAE